MKILHTADWHLGQKFYDYDRTVEQEEFLNWLLELIQREKIDTLIIAGDIFDVTNPSSQAQKLFYNFLSKARSGTHRFQIIITAGNHDSASRLEAPQALLEAFKISVSGSVKFITSDSGKIPDPMSMIIPLKNTENVITGYCLAVPFLRSGDYEWVFDLESSAESEEIDKSYTRGIKLFYQYLAQRLREINPTNLPVIATGHLHTSQAVLSDSERGIRGGLEVVSPESFDSDFSYVALGHIHKAQKVGGKENVRYSGSPIPMSFSETNYKHQVVIVEVDTNGEVVVKEQVVPRTVELIRIGTPVKPLTKSEVFSRLDNLPEITSDSSINQAPYLEINIMLDEPDLLINQDIKDILKNKQVRLARNLAYYPGSEQGEVQVLESVENLKEISPIEIFDKYYHMKYGNDIPEKLKELFNEVLLEIEIK